MFLNKNTKKSKKDDPKLCGLLHHSGSPFEDRRWGCTTCPYRGHRPPLGFSMLRLRGQSTSSKHGANSRRSQHLRVAPSQAWLSAHTSASYPTCHLALSSPGDLWPVQPWSTLLADPVTKPLHAPPTRPKRVMEARHQILSRYRVGPRSVTGIRERPRTSSVWHYTYGCADLIKPLSDPATNVGIMFLAMYSKTVRKRPKISFYGLVAV